MRASAMVGVRRRSRFQANRFCRSLVGPHLRGGRHPAEEFGSALPCRSRWAARRSAPTIFREGRPPCRPIFLLVSRTKKWLVGRHGGRPSQSLSNRSFMKRFLNAIWRFAARIGRLGFGLFVVLLVFWGLFYLGFRLVLHAAHESLQSHANPTADYTEAVSRFQKMQENEGPELNPVCRSILLTH